MYREFRKRWGCEAKCVYVCMCIECGFAARKLDKEFEEMEKNDMNRGRGTREMWFMGMGIEKRFYR